jgi:hypothetical protein
MYPGDHMDTIVNLNLKVLPNVFMQINTPKITTTSQKGTRPHSNSINLDHDFRCYVISIDLEKIFKMNFHTSDSTKHINKITSQGSCHKH